MPPPGPVPGIGCAMCAWVCPPSPPVPLCSGAQDCATEGASAKGKKKKKKGLCLGFGRWGGPGLPRGWEEGCRGVVALAVRVCSTPASYTSPHGSEGGYRANFGNFKAN